MKSLKEQIKDREFGNLYLLFGEEKYLVRLNLGRIRKAMLSEEDEMMNLEILETLPDPDLFEASIETFPFMAERRLIILKDTKLFSGKTTVKNMDEYALVLSSVPETSTVIFVEEEVDKRSRMYKLIQTKGQAFEFTHPEEDVLVQWITREFKNRRLAISRNEIAYLLSQTGTDMERIESEISKLESYCLDKGKVSKNDIDTVVSASIEASIFKMTDNLCEGRNGAAYRIYKDLIRQQEPVQRILFMIIRQIRLLYKTSLMSGTDAMTVAKELSVPAFAARNYQRQAAKLGQDKLYELMQKLLELDVKIKTGAIQADEAVELMILSYSANR